SSTGDAPPLPASKSVSASGSAADSGAPSVSVASPSSALGRFSGAAASHAAPTITSPSSTDPQSRNLLRIAPFDGAEEGDSNEDVENSRASAAQIGEGRYALFSAS